MNPVALVNLLAAVVVIVISVPLIRRKVKMNYWYGVRIPATFASEEAWFDINHYAGRLLLIWGLVLATTATVGVFLTRQHWVVYNRTALAIILGGLAIAVAKILLYARNRKTG